MNEGRRKWEQQKSLFTKENMSIGPTYAYLMQKRPRQFFFTYARYKFATRLLGEDPKLRVLELGCNEGLGTLLFTESGHSVTAVDFDGEAIAWAQENLTAQSDLVFMHEDFIGKSYPVHDATVLLDVIEHIPQSEESRLFDTITSSMHEDGFCIIGTPNTSAQQYSSETSRAGHINLYSPERLKKTMQEHFRNVFIFGMNDEVVHTGFYAMCHYIVALGCGRR